MKFGTFRIWIFPIGKKSTFVPKIGGKFSKKSCSNFFFLFLNMKLRQNKIIEIWNIPDSDFSNWKKFRFSSENFEFLVQKHQRGEAFFCDFWLKNTNEERPFFHPPGLVLHVLCWNSTRASLARSVQEFQLG